MLSYRAKRQKAWLTSGLVISVVVALLFSTHASGFPLGLPAGYRVAYWLLRFGSECLFFFGTVISLQLLFPSVRWKTASALGCMLSYPLWCFTIAGIDLVVAQPELGNAPSIKTLVGFAAVNLDNHIAYCVLIVVPRLYMDMQRPDDGEGDELANAYVRSLPRFLKSMPNEKRGQIQFVRAQEHYINVKTSNGETDVLYRFRDALEELADYDGLQVHRSWWVSLAAVRYCFRRNQRTYLMLRDGTKVPVSKTFEKLVVSLLPGANPNSADLPERTNSHPVPSDKEPRRLRWRITRRVGQQAKSELEAAERPCR